MGFFGKKKKGSDSSAKSGSAPNSPPPADTNDHHGGLLKTSSLHHPQRPQLPPASKSVRFASAVSDDEGGFVTDSELELNRATRHGSLRVRGEKPLAPALKHSYIDRSAVSRSQSYHGGRSQSYSEHQQYRVGQFPSTPAQATNGLWGSNAASGVMVDDDYMSDCSSASSNFTRGARVRSSLPIFKHNMAMPPSRQGLVFLSYLNETRKAVIPAEINNIETVKSMFVQAFPQLTADLLNTSRKRFYILDRPSNKFFLLVNTQDVRDGTMLKLVDSDTPTPRTIRKSRSAHSALTSDSHYYSEPEFDVDTSRGRRPIGRMAITKETNVDDYPTSWNGSHNSTLPSKSSQSGYLNTNTDYIRYPPVHPRYYSHPHMRETMSDWNLYYVRGDPYIGPSGALPNSHMGNQQLQPSAQMSVVSSANYIPPRQIHHSSVHNIVPPGVRKNSATSSDVDSDISGANANKDPLSQSDQTDDVKTAGERTRMAKMEAQIANLTAWVQTALSRPSSAASDRISDASYASSNTNSARSSISGASSATPQPDLDPVIKQKIVAASSHVKDLKAELKQLKRIHEAQSESIQDTLNDAFTKIQIAIKNIPGASQSPLRNHVSSIDASVHGYMAEQATTTNQISELEACVSELRGDVVSKRCHVNMGEVEALALRLSKATRSASELKRKFPKLAKDIQGTLHHEMNSVVRQQEFLQREPANIEDTLKRCKAITNVLFTLKRLAAIDTQRTVVVPKIHSKPVEDSTVKQLMAEVSSITVNHDERLKALQKAEQSVTRRRNILLAKDSLKLEKSLELTSKNLKEAESMPPTDTSDAKLSRMLSDAQAKESQSQPNGHTNGQNPGSIANATNGFTKRTKPAHVPHHIQNRDSINWDANSDTESSSDSSEDGGAHDFVDVTEAPASAFTVVQPQLNGTHRSQQNHQSNGVSHYAKATPNGKVYKAPSQQSHTATRNRELQQQYQKLQQLQRDHMKSPVSSTMVLSVPTNTPTSPSIQPVPGSLNRSFSTPTSYHTHISAHTSKPIIAPKPQNLSEKLSNQNSNNNRCHNSFERSILDSDAKSTTV